MKHTPSILASAVLIAVSLACGWRPGVTAVPITAPWSAMNLPVKENAVVWASTEQEFKAVHKERDKKSVADKYLDALKAQGWTLTGFEDRLVPDGLMGQSRAHKYYIDMAKGADKILIEIYDFENTGVIINKM